MLYGIDNRLQPQRQMVEAEEVSVDGLVWTFRLRPGLRFHDGEPVRASDAVASIRRWSARDAMGRMIRAIENELTAVTPSAEKTVSKNVASAGKERNSLLLHHARADRCD
jgi:peptide/nickel transport system substrate-binding protein